MSFSSDVKAELLTFIKSLDSKHCKTAVLISIINMSGFISLETYDKFVALHNENLEIVKIAKVLLFEVCGIKTDIIENEIVIEKEEDVDKIAVLVGLNSKGCIPMFEGFSNAISKNCCKRAYIGMAFLCCGYINDPNKQYHLEINLNDYKICQELLELISDFKIEMRVITRKGKYTLYCKEAEQIVDFLNVISAHKALLELENMRVIKEVRNNVNRIVNCETANINRVVNTAIKQIEDIKLILELKGLDYLPTNLKDIASLRLKYPEASLKELGEYLSPNISKYGVNHRLKKIHNIAESLKGDN